VVIETLGHGFVGSTTAYAFLITGTAAEIVPIDRDRKLAEGNAQDLGDAALFSHTTRFGRAISLLVAAQTSSSSQPVSTKHLGSNRVSMIWSRVRPFSGTLL
jgi:hypothetical protein